MSTVDVPQLIDQVASDEEKAQEAHHRYEGDGERVRRCDAKDPRQHRHEDGKQREQVDVAQSLDRVIDIQEVTVEGADRQIQQKVDEVSVVVVPDAVAGEYAVVVTFEHAHVAHPTVLRPGRRVSFAHGTEPPARLEDARQHHVTRRRVGRDRAHEARHHAGVEEQAEDDVQPKRTRAVFVDVRQNDDHFVHHD